MTAIFVDLRKAFPNFSLDLTFSVEEGITVLFGPSGAGKTLALHCIAGLVRPDSGSVRVGATTYFDHQKSIDLPIHKRRFGFVPQDVSLFPHMTVFENIAYGISTHQGKDREKAVRAMMELLRLDGLGSLLPREISGGQRQRVGLARALVVEPVAMLLDEPFTALDSPVRTKLREDLLRIRETFEVPTIFVTHDVEEAYFLADQIAVLNEGRIEQVGDREEVFYRPMTRQVAKFFGVKNIFSGVVVEADSGSDRMTVKTSRFKVSLAYHPSYPEGSHVEFCIRPEEVMIIRAGQPVKDILRENILDGRIVWVVDKGAQRDLFVQIGPQRDFDFQVTLPSHVARDLDLDVGRSVVLGLKRPSLWVIRGSKEPPEKSSSRKRPSPRPEEVQN